MKNKGIGYITKAVVLGTVMGAIITSCNNTTRPNITYRDLNRESISDTEQLYQETQENTPQSSAGSHLWPRLYITAKVSPPKRS